MHGPIGLPPASSNRRSIRRQPAAPSTHAGRGRRPRGRSLRGVRVLPAPLSPPRPTPAWKCISSINRQSSTCPERQRWRPSIIPAVPELPVLRTQLKRGAAPQNFSRLRIHVAGRRVVAVKIGYQKLFRFSPISKWKADKASILPYGQIRGAACCSLQWCRTGRHSRLLLRVCQW